MATQVLSGNPFALMVEPERVRAAVDRSPSLNRLKQKMCHPLDRAVIHSPSAELAAYDSKIDRKTKYVAPPELPRKPVTLVVEPIPELIG